MSERGPLNVQKDYCDCRTGLRRLLVEAREKAAHYRNAYVANSPSSTAALSAHRLPWEDERDPDE